MWGKTLLSRLRDGQLIIDTEITTGLLRLVDAVREILANIESTGTEGDQQYTEVRQTLIKLNERPSIGETAAAAHPLDVLSESVADHAVEPTLIEAAPAEILTAEHVTAPSDSAPKEKSVDSVAGNAIRVDVTLLDKLMNLVGELVLARNQVLQYTAAQKDVAFIRTRPAAQPDHYRVAGRRDENAHAGPSGTCGTSSRASSAMWPIRAAKKCASRWKGRETELDKTILEAIKDPLTHVIRNSVDHGVESPDKRRAAGKAEERPIVYAGLPRRWAGQHRNYR